MRAACLLSTLPQVVEDGERKESGSHFVEILSILQDTSARSKFNLYYRVQMLKKATLQTFFNLSYLKKDAKDVVSASHWLNGLGHVAFYSKVS